jgi:hypothetical protein
MAVMPFEGLSVGKNKVIGEALAVAISRYA